MPENKTVLAGNYNNGTNNIPKALAVDVNGRLLLSPGNVITSFQNVAGNPAQVTAPNSYDFPASGSSYYALVGGFNYSRDAFNPLVIDKVSNGLLVTPGMIQGPNIQFAYYKDPTLTNAINECIALLPSGYISLIGAPIVVFNTQQNEFEVTIFYRNDIS